MYFGNGSYNDGGYINFTDMVQKSIGEFADDFITLATISGNTLTVKTGSKILENYYSSYGPDEYFITDIYYDRYVVRDERRLEYQGLFRYVQKSERAEQRANIGSCYFYVTVKDSISGLTETVRLWLVSSVNGVLFRRRNLNFNEEVNHAEQRTDQRRRS